ncbi:MAG: hypothetical protein AAGJ28_10065 [Pseudomonadota bacterium]
MTEQDSARAEVRAALWTARQLRRPAQGLWTLLQGAETADAPEQMVEDLVAPQDDLQVLDRLLSQSSGQAQQRQRGRRPRLVSPLRTEGRDRWIPDNAKGAEVAARPVGVPGELNKDLRSLESAPRRGSASRQFDAPEGVDRQPVSSATLPEADTRTRPTETLAARRSALRRSAALSTTEHASTEADSLPGGPTELVDRATAAVPEAAPQPSALSTLARSLFDQMDRSPADETAQLTRGTEASTAQEETTAPTGPEEVVPSMDASDPALAAPADADAAPRRDRSTALAGQNDSRSPDAPPSAQDRPVPELVQATRSQSETQPQQNRQTGRPKLSDDTTRLAEAAWRNGVDAS